MTVRVEASVVLRADPEAAFAAMADVRAQEKWIFATTMYAVESAASPPQVGARIAAFTGFWSIGFLDTMTVTEYDPPRRWAMDKDGALLHGVGIMQVEPLAQGCRVSWANELELPFGILGRLGWPVARPLAKLALTAALRRMGKLIDKGVLPLAPSPAPEQQVGHSTGPQAVTT
jgi:uncharacterized protein YndB with AHSA1/START domain